MVQSQAGQGKARKGSSGQGAVQGRVKQSTSGYGKGNTQHAQRLLSTTSK